MEAVIFMQPEQNLRESESVIILHAKVKEISGQFQIQYFMDASSFIFSQSLHFRLTWENKTRTNHGLLEIKHNGVWGTVCDDSVNVTQVGITSIYKILCY